ncbi:hypothetical protein JW835_15155 [bacterium]|nr:hypothetical protein [bacterium]
MTAEIAIMNKTAVALAADSAVTIADKENQKIYNTVNKLFALSKYDPVGIMVYGSADIMGVPWETIIKMYRNHIANNNYSTLEEYAKSFITFLDNKNPLFPNDVQDNYFTGTVSNYFSWIHKEINDNVKVITDEDGEISVDNIKKIVNNTINKHYQIWNNCESLAHLKNSFNQNLLKKHAIFIENCIKNVFQELPLTAKNKQQLKNLSVYLFSKNRFPKVHSGIVIAGFGTNDIYPAINAFMIEAVINDRLKYIKNDNKCDRINFRNNATIIPFAQSENVHTFIEGMDPNCKKLFFSYLEELFDKYPSEIVNSIEQINEKEKKKIIDKLNDINKKILKTFIDTVQQYISETNIKPIINAVAFLPKDELASMAESLVNLTSFKQRISMDSETVGGPIDVAVISKGDGFIWIKRKHYFKPELNHHFFSNYFYTPNEVKNEKAN